MVVTIAMAACGHRRAPAVTVCPVSGPVMLYGPEDVDGLRACARVPGLTIRTGAPLDLSKLTALSVIDGDLVIGPTLAITTIALPALTEVTQTIRIAGNGELAGVFLPALRRVGALEVADDPGLLTFSAPALTEVVGPITLARLPSLEVFDSHALITVGGAVTVTGTPDGLTWLGRPAP